MISEMGNVAVFEDELMIISINRNFMVLNSSPTTVDLKYNNEDDYEDEFWELPMFKVETPCSK